MTEAVEYSRRQLVKKGYYRISSRGGFSATIRVARRPENAGP